MTSEQGKNSTWRDDLTALINKLQEENKLLQKVQESFQSAAESGGDSTSATEKEDISGPHSEEDPSELNENIHQ